MSEVPRWADICEKERTVVLEAAAACEPLKSLPSSPIDNFYDYTAALIPLGGKEALSKSDALGRTLLLGLVSGTEHYFRAVLAGIVRVCPVAKMSALNQSISFGAVEYYSKDDLGLALLENTSLATQGEIQKQTKRLVGIDIKQDSSLEAAFSEYEKLCHLRHAAVHSRGELGQQSLRDLGVQKARVRLRVHIELSAFHDAAAVSQTVVRAYNRFLYRKTVERWIANKLLVGRWAADRKRFNELYSLFYSRKDLKGYQTGYLAHRGMLATIRKSQAEGHT